MVPVCVHVEGDGTEGSKPHHHHWATMTVTCNVVSILGVREKRIRNIFGRMSVTYLDWWGSQDFI